MSAEQRKEGLKIAIRADGGDAVGFGHLSRCASLAKAFSRKVSSAKICFWCRESGSAKEFLAREGFDMIGIPTPEKPANTKASIEAFAPNVIILDMAEHVPDRAFPGWTRIERDYSTELAEVAPLSVQLDDFAIGEFEVDMIVNGGIVPEYTHYEKTRGAEILLGPSYVLLRPEFAVAHRRLRSIGRIARKFLIMDSGHRFTHLVPRFLFEIEKQVKNPEVLLISKAYAGNPNRINSTVSIELIGSIKDMASVMMESDIAITGGGTILYELAATGTPAIVAPAVDHQEVIAANFDSLGTVVDVGIKGPPPEISRAIALLTSEPAKRESMMMKGREIVDGLGADRVADAIIERTGIVA